MNNETATRNSSNDFCELNGIVVKIIFVSLGTSTTLSVTAQKY